MEQGLDHAGPVRNIAAQSKLIGGSFWPAVIGLALESCAGQFGKLTTAAYALTPTTTSILTTNVLCLALAVAISIAAGKVHDRFVFYQRWWAMLVCFGFSLGLFCHYSAYILTSSPSWLPLAGYYLATVIGYLYLFIWYERIFTFGLKSTLLVVGTSLIVRAGLQLLLFFMQDAPGICFLALMPIMSLPFFLTVLDKTQHEALLDAEDKSSSICAPSRVSHHKSALISMLTIMALLVLLNYLTNETTSQTASLASSEARASHLLHIAANILAGSVIVVFATARMSRALLFSFLFATAAISCLSSFSAPLTSGTAQAIYTLASQTSMRMLDFTAVFAAFVFLEKNRSPLRMFAAARIVHKVAFVAGVLLMQLSGESVSGFPPTARSVIVAGLFIALGIFFVCTEPPVHAKGSEGAEAEPAACSPLERAIAALSSQGRLTPTETTVLELAARGKNAESIRQELVVSVNTAKTHIRNIYAKLGVHSQQELIALVEDAERKAENP